MGEENHFKQCLYEGYMKFNSEISPNSFIKLRNYI